MIAQHPDSTTALNLAGYMLADRGERLGDAEKWLARARDLAPGDPAILDRLVQRLAPGGEIVLAGFYKDPLAFTFPPAFMREARFRIAAQWRRDDLELVRGRGMDWLVGSGDRA